MSKGYAAVGLIGPKTDHNAGGALRAVKCFNAELVLIEKARFTTTVTDTHKTWRHVPVMRVDDIMESIPYDCVPVCIEIVPGSHSLVDYVHPQRALYIFGPEDGSVRKEVVERCRDVVSIPSSLCLNLAATVNVVLYDRLAKQKRIVEPTKATQEGG